MSKKICFVVTVSMTADQFLRFAFEEFNNSGYSVFLVCDMDDEYISTLPEYVTPYPIHMSRGIDPKGLVVAINEMTKFFKKQKFDIVQYSTPNASFYASIAAQKAKVPVRLYCQWGLVYLGFSGMKRKIFKFIEKTVCKNSTDVQPDSKGNLEFCRNKGFYTPEKSRVVWNGSANGIDLEKFDISKKSEWSAQIHSEYNISNDKIIIGFLGRVGKDKGFEELMNSFKILQQQYDNLVMLYVGPNEKPDTVSQENLNYFENNKSIIYTGGWVDDAERYYASMDILIFPSYREGFGSVVIEAETMGVPVVVSDIPGPQNGIIDGETGYKVEAKQVEPIVEKVSQLIENKQLRLDMGEKGAQFAKENFNDKILVKKMIENRDWLIDRDKK